ncbi:MAG: META domain-containing protein [Alphaproteobacteria bacterium]|nr:META domain-containing protein [Alphaproteobacteria bacterium]
MKFKLFAIGACAMALAACDMNTQNPDMLKGKHFVANQPGATIVLSFAPDEMRVNGKVVNLYNGAYTADGDNIKFDGFASTMMMGEPGAMQTETEYFQFMPTVTTYELRDGTLVLTSDNGTEIVFTMVESDPLAANAAPAE